MTIMQEIAAAVANTEALERRVTELLTVNNRLVDQRRAASLRAEKAEHDLFDSDTALRSCNARAMRMERERDAAVATMNMAAESGAHWAEAYAGLQSSVLALYTAGRWSLGGMSDEDQAALWSAVRDAAGIAEGTATARGEGAPDNRWIANDKYGYCFFVADTENFVFGEWTGDCNMPIGTAYQWRRNGEGSERVWLHHEDRPFASGTEIRRAYRIGEWHDWNGADKGAPIPDGMYFECEYKSGRIATLDMTDRLTALWSDVTRFRPIGFELPAVQPVEVAPASHPHLGAEAE